MSCSTPMTFVQAAAAMMILNTMVLADDAIKFIDPSAERGMSAAVVVPNVALVHTAQLLPVDRDGTLVSRTPREQVNTVLNGIEATLKSAGSSLENVARLNVSVTEFAMRDIVAKAIVSRFPQDRLPSVSFVQSQLPVDGANVAIDAVAATSQSVANVSRSASVATMPPGRRIYIAGQAEQSESLTEATRKTLESLRATLKFLGRDDRDVVQAKAFLMPMSDSDTVRRVFSDFYGDQAMPLVLVEWKSSAKTPIEIELVAWGGNEPAKSGEPVPLAEYLTPPGMTTSPVYSRVARTGPTPMIFLSRLVASPVPDADATTAVAAEREVTAVFDRLRHVLKSSGSDLKHLIKATYYVSTDSASLKLNELRPKYYDPKRPPAASKAVVAGVVADNVGLSIDMIAVPGE